MVQEVRAVYEDGRLRLLDPVTLADGEQVQLTIISARERTCAALGDLLAIEPDSEDAVDEARLQAEIDVSMRGVIAVSEAIIEERQDGP